MIGIQGPDFFLVTSDSATGRSIIRMKEGKAPLKELPFLPLRKLPSLKKLPFLLLYHLLGVALTSVTDEEGAQYSLRRTWKKKFTALQDKKW